MLVCELFMRSRFDQTKTTTRERESYSRNAPALVRVFSEIFLIETHAVVLKFFSLDELHALFSPRFRELQQLIANGQEQDMEAFLVGLEQQRREEQTEIQ